MRGLTSPYQNSKLFLRGSTSSPKQSMIHRCSRINARYRIFSPGQTVVDLGYAPGAWSQVAVDFTRPHGRVLGIDIIPAQPPKGVSTIQGNFLSPRIQAYVREFLRNHDRGRSRKEESLPVHSHHESTTEVETVNFESGHINREKCANKVTIGEHSLHHSAGVDGTVDVVLSDMSAPWQLDARFSEKK
ncbi:2' O-ribose methyltransferase [Emydomyces testavorans]|uniref:rRNA methyltransferase 2, mitochondrial n=1 Tax=Emydomyces testavorans TaxID=2070801 RepID=A0AAF0DC73_9EURO|nr:2' O-ribose methyltransferase [Emydomyces testavorans]